MAFLMQLLLGKIIKNYSIIVCKRNGTDYCFQNH